MHPRLTNWRLDGRTALVTGASKGIGFACARELAVLGANVLHFARDEGVLLEVSYERADESNQSEILWMAAAR